MIASDTMTDNGDPLVKTYGGVPQQLGLFRIICLLGESQENTVYNGFVSQPSDEEWEAGEDDDDEWEEPEV